MGVTHSLKQINRMNFPITFSESTLQILAVTTYVYIMFLATSFLLPLLLLTRLWWIPLIYCIWLYFDKNTFETGGRQINWLKNMKAWEYSKRHFPISLVLTDDCLLDPKKNYLFCCFPHGFVPTGIVHNLLAVPNKVQMLNPHIKMHLATLPQFNLLPLHREVIMGCGAISCSAKSLSHVLSRPEGGHVVCLLPGGIREIACAYRGVYKFVVKRRKGFIKIALKTGSPIVPVITFGENDTFQLVECSSSVFLWFQQLVIKWIGLIPVIFYGRGFRENSFGWIPFKEKLTTVVGKPINVEKVPNPSDELVDEIHEKFVDSLSQLFHEYKFYLKQPQDSVLLLE